MKQGTMNILFFILKTKLLLKRVFGKETEMRTLLGTMNEEIEKMKKAVNIDYAPVTINRYINVMKKLQKAIPDFYGTKGKKIIKKLLGR